MYPFHSDKLIPKVSGENSLDSALSFIGAAPEFGYYNLHKHVSRYSINRKCNECVQKYLTEVSISMMAERHLSWRLIT